MKKFLILLVLLLVCSNAMADIPSDLYWAYKPYAQTFGAPMYSMDGISVYNADKNTYKADAGTISIIYEITATDSIRTVLVCAKDDTCAADFLCTCAAMITYLGKTDFTAFGNVLGSFSLLRSGSISAPSQVGIDSFNMMSNDDFKYLFMYANNDLTAN